MTMQRNAGRFMDFYNSVVNIEVLIEENDEVGQRWRDTWLGDGEEGFTRFIDYLEHWMNYIEALPSNNLQDCLDDNVRELSCLCLARRSNSEKRPDGRYQVDARVVNFWIWLQDHGFDSGIPWKMKYNPTGQRRPGKGTKLTISWVACLIHEITPDVTMPNWEEFDCSHLCGRKTDFCLDWRCYCWESKSDNQARGNRLCRKSCGHGRCKQENICSCTKTHFPPCH